VAKRPAFLRGIILFIIGSSVSCGWAFSQASAPNGAHDLTNLSIEELGDVEVYSASKFNQRASEAPASISIITAGDIRRYGYRSFDEILSSVSGFYSTYDRNYAYLGARGFGLTGDYNSRILLLVDGHRLNDNVYYSSSIGRDFPLSLELIERIEIVRGPGSSLYGTNAFFAVVNVITRRGRAFNGTHVFLEAGSRQTYQGTATFGRLFNSGFEVLVSGSYLNSKGYRRLYFPEFDSPDNNGGIAQDADTEKNANLFANISHRDFNVQLAFKSREKHFPTAAFGTTFNDRKSQTTDTAAYVDVKFERSFRNDWDILARTFMDAYTSDGSYPYSYSDEGTEYLEMNKDKVSGRFWGGETKLTRTFSGRHHLSVGTEWRYSFQGDQLNYDESDYYVYLDSREKTTDFGTYIQGEFAARENVLFSGGIRYDHYSTFGGTTNPRFGLVYAPRENTTMKLLYGHAFRAPNLFELYYNDGYSSKANPELQPERIRTLELVLEQRIHRKFRISGSAYRYEVKDQITQTTDPSDDLIVFQNLGTVHAQGVELELEGKDVGGFDGRLSYALQRSVSLPGKAPLTNSPQHIAQLNLFKPLFGMRGGAGLEMRYLSSRKTLAGKYTGGFLLANLTVSCRKLLPNLDLSASIFNMFNRRYYHPGGSEHVSDSLLQDGRSFRITLGYAFPIR
jgi:iron complex outermembrane receptor protein